MKKTLKQLEEENADIINDKILQEICEWGLGSPVDRMKDNKIFDEEEYLERAKKNLEMFKDKCEKALKLFDDNKHPKSELRHDSNMNYYYTKDVVVSGTLSFRSISLSVSQIAPDESGLIWSPHS